MAKLASAVAYISAEGLDSSNKCPDYDTKQSDGKALVMLELWRMKSTSLLPIPPTLVVYRSSYRFEDQ